MPTIDRLPFTGDDEADRLLVDEPLALLIGFELDQQVPLQKAFSGPLELKRRIGGLDAAAIASMDPEKLDDGLPRRRRRCTGSRATWPVGPRSCARSSSSATTATRPASGPRRRTARTSNARLLELPGFGPMKAGTIVAILGKQLGVTPPGWEAVAPDHMTLGDVDSAEKLATTRPGSAPTRRRCGRRASASEDRCGRRRFGCRLSCILQLTTPEG